MHEGRQVVFNKGKISTYKGMSDLYCNYVTITTGNTQETYYQLNNRNLDNDFLIASPLLKEAIDPEIPKTSLGLISKQGNIIIPFENRDIRIIDDKYLLVIRNIAQTKTVLDAIASRDDPNAATRMVDTDNNIKDRINKETHGTGKFLLNDRFSEGTLYTIDGKNILDNKYYSFICMTDDSFYCSVNVADSPIVEVARNAPVFNDNFAGPLPVVEPEQSVIETPPIDIASVEVPKETIDTALNSSLPKEDNSTNLETKKVVEEKKIVPAEQPAKASSFIQPLSEVKPDSIFGEKEQNDIFEAEKPKESSFGGIPIIRSNSDNNDQLGGVSLNSTDTNNAEGSIKDENTSLESNSNSGDSFDDVVTAVGGLVQENKRQQQELKQKDLKILTLQERLQSAQQQGHEVDELKAENERLQLENDRLQQRVVSLEDAFRKMRAELTAPASYGSTEVQYKRVA